MSVPARPLNADAADAARAMEALDLALEQMTKARAHDDFRQPGLLAQVRLRLLLLLRIRDRNAARQNVEGHRDAILKIAVRPDDRKVWISYLHWYQAIALGLGDVDGLLLESGGEQKLLCGVPVVSQLVAGYLETHLVAQRLHPRKRLR